jgi:hypothetical protein
MRIMNYKIILKKKILFDSHYENSTEIVYELDENGNLLFQKTGKLF